MPRRVTLQTIADAVGVSRATVSNAYNRPDQLGEALRTRILETAAGLGYRGPDAAARMLRTGQMGTIALVFTEDLRFVFNDPDTMLFMRGVAETSALAGSGLTLLPVPADTDPATTPIPAVAADGSIVFSVAAGHPVVERLVEGDRPLVIVDEPDLGDRASFVGIDDRAGAALAARHLVDLGHRRLAVLMGRLDVDSRQGRVDPRREAEVTIRVARERLAGYRAAWAEAGFDPAELVVWEAGGSDPDVARRATTELIARHPDVTGLICFTDQLAIGACQAVVRAGRRVPDDVSVVGFDDVPRASTWEPPLTTVSQPLVDKGRAAADLLLELIDGRPPRRIQLPIELVVRESSAAPPS